MPGRSGWDHLNAGRTRLAELCFFGIWVLGTNKHTTPEYNPEYTNILKDFGPISVVPKSKHRLCFCGMLVDILKHVKFLVMFGFHGHANQLYCMTVLFLDVDHAFVSFQQHTESSAPRLRLTKWCKMSGLRWVISSEAILQSLPLPPPRGILRAFSKGGQCPCHMVHLIMVIYGDLWWWIWFIVVYDTCMVIDLDQRSMNFWGPCCWLSTISICSLALTENGVSLRSLLFMLLSAFCTNCWILIVKLHSLWIIAILFIGSMTDARTEVSEILWSASKSYQEWNSAVLFSVANLSCPGLWVHDKVLIRAEFRLQSLSTNSEIHFFWFRSGPQLEYLSISNLQHQHWSCPALFLLTPRKMAPENLVFFFACWVGWCWGINFHLNLQMPLMVGHWPWTRYWCC